MPLRNALPDADPARPQLGSAIDAGLAQLHLRLETGAYADSPELDQAVRRLWGAIYTDFSAGKAATLTEYAEVSLPTGLSRLRAQYDAPRAGIVGARDRTGAGHAPDRAGASRHGVVARDQRRYAESIPAYERAVTELESAVGRAHRATAVALAGLGLCLGETGALERADQLTAEAVDLGLSLPGTPLDQFSHIFFARGHVLLLLGRHADAVGLLEGAWKMMYQYVSPQFAWQGTLVRDLAHVHQALGCDAAVGDWQVRMHPPGAPAQ